MKIYKVVLFHASQDLRNIKKVMTIYEGTEPKNAYAIANKLHDNNANTYLGFQYTLAEVQESKI